VIFAVSHNKKSLSYHVPFQASGEMGDLFLFIQLPKNLTEIYAYHA
jgi:hypothetical protein